MSPQDTILFIHAFNIIAVLGALTAILIQNIKCKWDTIKLLWSIPMTVWLLHGLVLHTFVFINNYYNLGLLLPTTINLWVAAYVGQGLLTVMTIEIARLIYSNMQRGILKK